MTTKTTPRAKSTAPTFPEEFTRKTRMVDICGKQTRFVEPGLFQVMRFQSVLSIALERGYLSEQEQKILTAIEKQARLQSRLEAMEVIRVKTMEGSATPDEILESYMQIGGMFRYPDLNEMLERTIFECFPDAMGLALSDKALGQMVKIITDVVSSDPQKELARFLAGAYPGEQG
jgi:hypothetical protein